MVGGEEGEGWCGVGDVVVEVGGRVDVQGLGELGVTLQLEALVVAVEDFGGVAWGALGSEAFHGLLLVLAGASYECFCLAWIYLLARVRCVAWIRAIVFADCFLPSARLGTRCGGVLALSWSVARLLTEMNATLKLQAARQATGNLIAPAGLVLQRFLTTCARLLNQVRTRRTRLGVFVALMLDLLVAAGRAAGTFIIARWWTGTAWLRRMQDCAPTITGDFFENSFETGATGTFVAERLTGMIPAFQHPATDSEADVLGLNILFSCHASSLALCSLAFAGFLLSWTATLSAFMSTAVESRTADSSAGWWLLSPLVTHTI